MATPPITTVATTSGLSDTTLGSRVSTAVEAAIEASGLTQHAVAHAAGIPRETFRRRLIDRTSWTLGELEAVAKALNVDPSTLVLAGELAGEADAEQGAVA